MIQKTKKKLYEIQSKPDFQELYVLILSSNGNNPTSCSSMFKKISKLIADGFDINAPIKSGFNCLALASKRNNTFLAQELLLYGADVNHVNIYDKTALHFAVESINTKMINFLLENGANVNVQDIYGEAPFFYLSELESFGLIKKFIDLGADLSIKNKHNKTCFDKIKDLQSKAELEIKINQYYLSKKINSESFVKFNKTPKYI